MALNLDDNKRPYFKQLNLDETFDEIQNAFNTLENSVPSPSSDVTVNQLVTIATASVGSLVISNTASIATSAADDSVLTINNTTGKVNKKTGRNTYEALITQSGTASPVITDVITAITASLCYRFLLPACILILLFTCVTGVIIICTSIIFHFLILCYIIGILTNIKLSHLVCL